MHSVYRAQDCYPVNVDDYDLEHVVGKGASATVSLYLSNTTSSLFVFCHMGAIQIIVEFGSSLPILTCLLGSKMTGESRPLRRLASALHQLIILVI